MKTLSIVTLSSFALVAASLIACSSNDTGGSTYPTGASSSGGGSGSSSGGGAVGAARGRAAEAALAPALDRAAADRTPTRASSQATRASPPPTAETKMAVEARTAVAATVPRVPERLGSACTSNATCSADFPDCEQINMAIECTKPCTNLGAADPACPTPVTSGNCNQKGFCH